MNVAFLGSGGLGFLCLKHLFKTPYRITAVLTDKNSFEIIELAKQMNLPVLAGNPRNGRSVGFLRDKGVPVELILSVNYLFMIDKDLIQYPTLGAVNLHGSLLPKYRGRTPHVWAIINNEKITGVSAHMIDEHCDAGGIIEQVEIHIDPEDTGASILSKYQEIYPDLILKVLRKFETNQCSPLQQEHEKATYFGKRTPDDGAIVWSWQRERINNWVRAQAYPYPGAFSYYNGQKITIDKIEFDDMGFNFADADGLILSGGQQPIIKTPNGAIKLTRLREITDFKKGDVLI